MRRRVLIPLSVMSAGLLGAMTLVGIVAFTWPLFVHASSPLLTSHGAFASWFFVCLVPLLLLVALAELRDGNLDVKTVALLAILVAVGTVLRIVGSGISGGEPLFALVILTGWSLGRGFGYLYGATVLFCSALATGFVGPWLPFQMLACAWLGFLAGCLPAVKGKRDVVVVAGFGALGAIFYGTVMDLWFWPFQVGLNSTVSFVAGDTVLANLYRFFIFDLTTSLGFDLLQAVTNVVLIVAFGRAVTGALDRTARGAAFGANATFGSPEPLR